MVVPCWGKTFFSILLSKKKDPSRRKKNMEELSRKVGQGIYGLSRGVTKGFPRKEKCSRGAPMEGGNSACQKKSSLRGKTRSR